MAGTGQADNNTMDEFLPNILTMNSEELEQGLLFFLDNDDQTRDVADTGEVFKIENTSLNDVQFTHESNMTEVMYAPDSVYPGLDSCQAYTPDRNVFPGVFNFRVQVNCVQGKKCKYWYSSKLNRIYLDKDTDFAVQYEWEQPVPQMMYVRAMVVFSDPSQAQKPVERCTEHKHEAANKMLDPAIVMNVLHSARGPRCPGVQYAARGGWRSVRVGCPPPAPHAHAYKFVCKNSCASGINRRAIEIMFQLEDAQGRVFGRQMMGARVCACPKRDKVRDEEAVEQRAEKRSAPATAPAAAPEQLLTKTKKIKIEAVVKEDDVLAISTEVVGVTAALAGLGAMLQVMEYEARRRPAAIDKYQPRIHEIKKKIDYYKSLRTADADDATNT